MASTQSGRHCRPGRHRQDAASPADGTQSRHRAASLLRLLSAAAAVLALVLAASAYAAVQGRGQAPAVAAPASSASAPPASPGSAAGHSSGATASGPASSPQPAAAPSTGPPDATPASRATASAPPPAVVPAAAVTAINGKLEARINAVITANSRYQVGVALIDVADGVVHEYGVKAKFVAASTAKILAAASFYHLVETGRASLGSRLGVSTAGVQIRQMVQQSNNESWALIMAAVTNRGLTDYAASLGIRYDRTLNTLTPAETARILHLLYTGQLLSAEHTAQLLSYMQNTNYESLIPAAVPAGISVFHKYGLLFGNLHDSSILVQGGRAYVFVVYTLGRDMSDAAARTRVIQQLTKTVTAGVF